MSSSPPMCSSGWLNHIQANICVHQALLDEADDPPLHLDRLPCANDCQASRAVRLGSGKFAFHTILFCSEWCDVRLFSASGSFANKSALFFQEPMRDCIKAFEPI